MGDVRITKATGTFGAIRVGAGVRVRKIASGSVAVDPASISANTDGTVNVTVAGVAAGDKVVFEPPDALEAGLVYKGCRVTGADTVRIYLRNVTGGAIDGVSRTWDYMWFDLT